MAVAITIGIVGLGMTKAGSLEFLEGSTSETIIVRIAGLISGHGILTAILAGVILAGILAATMSTADSQMLAAASSVSQNIVQDFLHIKLNEKQSLIVARITIAAIAILGISSLEIRTLLYLVSYHCMGRLRRRIRCCNAVCTVLETF